MPSSSSMQVQLHRRVHRGRARLVDHDAGAGDRHCVPGRPSSRSAIWLPIVPDGTKTAASLPTRSANAPRAAHGRVLAVAVVAHLGLGHRPAHRRRRLVTVSERRSTHAERLYGVAVDQLPGELLAIAPRPCRARPRPLLVDGLTRHRAEISTKSTGTDMVTEMDRASEASSSRASSSAGRTTASSARKAPTSPGHRACAGSSTRSTARPTTSTGSRLRRLDRGRADGEVVAGVVQRSAARRRVHRARGAGATRNGEPLRAPDQTTSRGARRDRLLLRRPERRAAGRGAGPGPPPRPRHPADGRRRVDLCSVAVGRVDAYYERGSARGTRRRCADRAEAGAVVGELDGTGGRRAHSCRTAVFVRTFRDLLITQAPATAERPRRSVDRHAIATVWAGIARDGRERLAPHEWTRRRPSRVAARLRRRREPSAATPKRATSRSRSRAASTTSTGRSAGRYRRRRVDRRTHTASTSISAKSSRSPYRERRPWVAAATCVRPCPAGLHFRTEGGPGQSALLEAFESEPPSHSRLIAAVRGSRTRPAPLVMPVMSDDWCVGTRILTVEDDERIRTAVKMALEDEGWTVEEAEQRRGRPRRLQPPPGRRRADRHHAARHRRLRAVPVAPAHRATCRS